MITTRFVTLLARWVLGGEAGAGDAPKILKAEPVPLPESDFRVEVFWAYGCASIVLFLFMLWSSWQARRLDERVEVLRERFERKFPETKTNETS